jgi:hypothetical protein
MDKTATTMKAEEAIARIGTFATKEAIEAFMVDEDRKTIIAAATDKLASLQSGKPKAGEQKGPITKDAADFKEGVQKTKSYITGEDVIEKMRKEGKKI